MKDIFEYQKPTDEQVEKISRVRQVCQTLHGELLENVPEGRERSLAITKLEEVSMWANKGVVFEE